MYMQSFGCFFFIVVLFNKIWKLSNSSLGVVKQIMEHYESIKMIMQDILISQKCCWILSSKLYGCEAYSPLSLQSCKYACMYGCLFTKMVDHGYLQVVIFYFKFLSLFHSNCVYLFSNQKIQFSQKICLKLMEKQYEVPYIEPLLTRTKLINLN